jgi:type II secretory pathway component GspD/PulD (secretin)
MLARLDVPVPQVLIQVEMLDVDKSTMDKMGADFNVVVTATGASKMTNFPWDDDNAVKKYGGSQDISSGTIDASTASVLLEFIKNQGTTRSLARPRIVTVDNETAQVKISTDEAIGITQETSSTGSIGTSSTEAEREETGVILTVTPQVNILTDEITLAVEPKVKVAKQSTITIQGQNLKDPEERSVKAILRVRSGDTIFIGGLLRRADAETQSSLPILGDIPILGMAFRHKSKIVADRELVVFITPHILGPSADMPETIREDLLKIPEVRERNALKQKRTGLIDQEMDKAAEQK